MLRQLQHFAANNKGNSLGTLVGPSLHHFDELQKRQPVTIPMQGNVWSTGLRLRRGSDDLEGFQQQILKENPLQLRRLQ